MSWFKSDPATIAAREAAKAVKSVVNELSTIFYRGKEQKVLGPGDLKRAMELIDKLDNTANFLDLLKWIMHQTNAKEKLLKKLIDKIKEVNVDIPYNEIIEIVRDGIASRDLRTAMQYGPERRIADTNALKVLVNYASYLKGENDNSGANVPAASIKAAAAPAAPAASMKPANASMKPANASMKPANAPNAPLNQGKLEDGLQRLEMDLKEEGTSLNFIVDKEATPSLYRYGKMVLGQAPASSMQAAPAPAPTPAPVQAAPTKLTFAQRKAARYGAPAASMPQATMATGGMRSRKRRNSKTRKGRTSKSKTPRKAKK